MKIALCDDDHTELERVFTIVENYVQAYLPNIETNIKTYSQAEDLLQDLSANGCFDLLILDIILPGMDGIELAYEIRKKNSECKIIFLTSSEEFALPSYKVGAFYYLLKPINDEELIEQLHRFFSSMKEEQNSYVIIREGGQFRRIFFHSLLYIESVKHMIYFNLTDGNIYSCYGTMSEFSTSLLKDSRFVKCHKSYLVNMEHVIRLSSQGFLLTNKTLVPISRQSYAQIKNLFTDYFFGKG